MDSLLGNVHLGCRGRTLMVGRAASADLALMT